MVMRFWDSPPRSRPGNYILGQVWRGRLSLSGV